MPVSLVSVKHSQSLSLYTANKSSTTITPFKIHTTSYSKTCWRPSWCSTVLCASAAWWITTPRHSFNSLYGQIQNKLISSSPSNSTWMTDPAITPLHPQKTSPQWRQDICSQLSSLSLTPIPIPRVKYSTTSARYPVTCLLNPAIKYYSHQEKNHGIAPGAITASIPRAPTQGNKSEEAIHTLMSEWIDKSTLLPTDPMQFTL